MQIVLLGSSIPKNLKVVALYWILLYNFGLLQYKWAQLRQVLILISNFLYVIKISHGMRIGWIPLSTLFILVLITIQEWVWVWVVIWIWYRTEYPLLIRSEINKILHMLIHFKIVNLLINNNIKTNKIKYYNYVTINLC